MVLDRSGGEFVGEAISDATVLPLGVEPIDEPVVGHGAFVMHIAGKQQLVIAGVVTEVCVAFPALSALAEGFEVFVVTDASGTCPTRS